MIVSFNILHFSILPNAFTRSTSRSLWSVCIFSPSPSPRLASPRLDETKHVKYFSQSTGVHHPISLHFFCVCCSRWGFHGVLGFSSFSHSRHDWKLCGKVLVLVFPSHLLFLGFYFWLAHPQPLTDRVMSEDLLILMNQFPFSIWMSIFIVLFSDFIAVW